MCTATGAAAGSEGLDRVRLHAALARAGRELDPLPLLQAAVTALVGDRGEVHEHVVPAVVGLDEPEALLGVEPPHRALAPTAAATAGSPRPPVPRRGRPAIVTGRRPTATPQRLDRVRLRTPVTRTGRERYPLPRLQAAVTAVGGDRGEVHEHVVPAVVGLDEPESLLGVEPLDRALRAAATAPVIAAVPRRGLPAIVTGRRPTTTAQRLDRVRLRTPVTRTGRE